MPEITVIIVNYNTGRLLEKCLLSIERFKGSLDIEIIVVDNNSSDVSRMFLEKLTTHDRPAAPERSSGGRGKRQTTKLKNILLDKNLGFARANNLAFKQARGKYIFLLNPDTEIKQDTLQNLKSFFELKEYDATGTPQAGALGPKLLFPDGQLQHSIRNFPRLWDQAIILSKLHNLSPRLVKDYLQLHFDYAKPQVVEQIMGAAIFTSRGVIEKLGLFDTRFKRNFEEVDWCKRVKFSGLKIFYTPDAEVVHHKGASFLKTYFKISLKRQLYFSHDMLHYFQKHKPAWQSLVLLVFQVFNFAITLLLFLLTSLIPAIKALKKRQN